MWLRELKPSKMLEAIAKLEDKIVGISNRMSNNLDCVKDYLNYTKWLQTEPNDSCPFKSSLDWAAFQITGFIQQN
jgi:hypothetical protein